MLNNSISQSIINFFVRIEFPKRPRKKKKKKMFFLSFSSFVSWVDDAKNCIENYLYHPVLENILVNEITLFIY